MMSIQWSTRARIAALMATFASMTLAAACTGPAGAPGAPGASIPTGTAPRAQNQRGNGGVDGGGGRAVVCRNADGGIRTAELLDFYEARSARFNRTIVKSNAPAIEQAHEALRNFANGIAHGSEDDGRPVAPPPYAYDVDSLRARFRLMENAGLNDVPDSRELTYSAESGCKTEQVANYTADGDILVDAQIFAKFDETNKAGMIAHEKVYEVFREFGATDSIRARRVVGLLFSGHRFERADARLAGTGAKRWFCWVSASSAGQVLPPEQRAIFAFVTRKISDELEAAEVHLFSFGTRLMVGPTVATRQIFSRAGHNYIDEQLAAPSSTPDPFPGSGVRAGSPEYQRLLMTTRFPNPGELFSVDDPELGSDVDHGLRVAFAIERDSIRSRTLVLGPNRRPEQAQEFQMRIGLSNRRYQMPSMVANCTPDDKSWPGAERR